MDNKTEYFTLKEDGVIGWIENCPLAPVKSFAAAHYVSAEMEYQVAVLEYNEALQSAISNAKEVSNSDEVARKINESKEGHRSVFESLDYGRVYTLQCHVEKIGVDETGNSNCSDDNVVKEVALVTFPSSAGVEETQEELWKQMFQQIGSRMDFMQFLLEHYTITRKNK